MLAGKPAPYDVFRAALADAEALLRHGCAPAGGDGHPEHPGFESSTRSSRGLRLGPVEISFGPRASGGSAGSPGARALQLFLRQSLVAAGSALETYVVDKAMECAAARIAAGESSPPLKELPESSADRAHRRSQRRSAIDAYVQATRRITADRIGHILSSVGVEDWTSHVDESRCAPEETTARELSELSRALNQVVRPPDGDGRRREVLDAEEVAGHLRSVASIVEALEAVLSSRDVPAGEARV